MDFSIINKLDTYRRRQFILIIVDICIVIGSYCIASGITGEFLLRESIVLPLIIYIALNIIFLNLFKCYSSLWYDSGDSEFISISISTISYLLPIIFINEFLGYHLSSVFYIINTLLILLLTCSSRIMYRAIRRIGLHMSISNNETASRVLVIGGGSAGELVIKELYKNIQLGKVPVGIIDDNKNKIGNKIHNIPILGSTEDIVNIANEKNIDEIIFSIANISLKRKQEIINLCKKTKCKLKTIPGIFEIIDGKVDIKNIRDVDIEDLLGREPVEINLEKISCYIKNKTILVTGGGGSIGSELCRQISKFSPKKLIILDIYENGAYELQQELIRSHEGLNLEVVIGSVRDKKRLDTIFNNYKPEVVFHAAAHKHVPLMEASPCEAIKNNVFGTLNVASTASKHNASRFVLISTDKAVNPTNIMGATKRCAEMIIQTINENSKTEFVAVRFGNVLGSNGSVIPLFKKQIKDGGPVMVTHPDITRYFMTIPEAVSLVMQAGAMAKGGEIFVLNMGESVKILDLAKNLISLSGFEPDKDIKIEFSGLRPGEKLYEELLMEEEGLKQTEHNKIFIGKPIDIDENRLNLHLEVLKKAVEKEEVEIIEPIIMEIVPTFVRGEYAENEAAVTV